MTEEVREIYNQLHFKDKHGIVRLKGHRIIMGCENIRRYTEKVIRPTRKYKMVFFPFDKVYGDGSMGRIITFSIVSGVKSGRLVVCNGKEMNESELLYLKDIFMDFKEGESCIAINTEFGEWTYKNVPWHEVGHLETMPEDGVFQQDSEYKAHKWALDEAEKRGYKKLKYYLLKELDEAWRFSGYSQHIKARAELLWEYREFYGKAALPLIQE